jgi:hypothetical protein
MVQYQDTSPEADFVSHWLVLNHLVKLVTRQLAGRRHPSSSQVAAQQQQPVAVSCKSHVPTRTTLLLPRVLLPRHFHAAACTPDGNGITYNENVNVALAVAMPDGGLITPVLKNADKVTPGHTCSCCWTHAVMCKSSTGYHASSNRVDCDVESAWKKMQQLGKTGLLWVVLPTVVLCRAVSCCFVVQTDIYQLSRNWADLVKRARGKQLAPDEYNSGTFTISNLGMFGVDTFDAILPPGAFWVGHWLEFCAGCDSSA